LKLEYEKIDSGGMPVEEKVKSSNRFTRILQLATKTNVRFGGGKTELNDADFSLVNTVYTSGYVRCFVVQNHSINKLCIFNCAPKNKQR
jgi:hypothetical protein